MSRDRLGLYRHIWRKYRQIRLPLMNEVFTYVGQAKLRVYYNGNNYPHLLDLAKDIPANVCHVGPKHDLIQTSDTLNKCVMGNVHPIEELLRGSMDDVEKRCKRIIESAGKGGGIWLSTAGGMEPETPNAVLIKRFN